MIYLPEFSNSQEITSYINADVNTFRAAVYPGTNEPTEWAKDSSHVYDFVGDGGILVNDTVDAPTFNVYASSSYPYFSDKDKVYDCETGYDSGCPLQTIPGADPATFHPVTPAGESYDAQDKNHKYLRGKIVS
jgi:hypothetical protein